MMNTGNIVPPCGLCPRKGCGAYHDECERYREYLGKVAGRRNAEYQDCLNKLRPKKKRRR